MKLKEHFVAVFWVLLSGMHWALLWNSVLREALSEYQTVGGGPFNLNPGGWTNDTSMALCLSESLIPEGEFDPVDQLERYAKWDD